MEIFSVITTGAGVLLVVLHTTVAGRGRDTSRPTVHGSKDFACPLRAGEDIACYKSVPVKSRLRDLPGDPRCHD